MSDKDLAFETLSAVRANLTPDMDEKLVADCYAIQKKHQFDADRAVSSRLMDSLIEKYVDALVAKGSAS